MKKTTAKVLTNGSPTKQILGFMISVYLGMLLQELYSSVDMIIIGKYIGVEALAGVGCTSSINFFVLGFCTGMCTGLAIPVAREFGAKNYEKMQRYVANIIWVSLFFSILVTVIAAPLTGKILTLSNTPDDVFNYAYIYIFTLLCGTPTCFLFNVSAGLIRAVGDSKTPVFCLIVSSITNVSFNLIAIIVLKVGVMGVAISTILSNIIASVLCLVVIKRRLFFLIPKKHMFKPDFSCIKTLIVSGLPMGIQTSITAVGTMIVQTAINGFGSLYMAAITSAGRIQQLFQSMFNALGTTAATFCSQNLGAKQYDRIKKGIRSCNLIGIAFGIFSLAVLYFFGGKLLLLFLDASEIQSLELAKEYIIICALFYVFLHGIITYRYAIQGIGYASIAMFAGLFETLMRAFMAFYMVPVFGFKAIYITHPAAWFAGTLFVFPMFHILYRKVRRDAGLLKPIRPKNRNTKRPKKPKPPKPPKMPRALPV